MATDAFFLCFSCALHTCVNASNRSEQMRLTFESFHQGYRYIMLLYECASLRQVKEIVFLVVAYDYNPGHGRTQKMIPG